jgi:serine/threonine protein kinase
LSNIEPTPFGDKYVLVEHIATGGMAEIYRAQYSGIEGFAKELVVKRLREEFASRPSVVQMFLDEARVAATLTHQNVVHTYDLGELQGEYFIAMELLKGEELVAVLRRAVKTGHMLPMQIALGIIMQALEGLHYVHTRADDRGRLLGLCHRDINPTNVHVGYDGTCKIVDFGIAATRASLQASGDGQFAGKLAYMAPEQVLGHELDLRADIFALGIVLYEMCLSPPPVPRPPRGGRRAHRRGRHPGPDLRQGRVPARARGDHHEGARGRPGRALSKLRPHVPRPREVHGGGRHPLHAAHDQRVHERDVRRGRARRGQLRRPVRRPRRRGPRLRQVRRARREPRRRAGLGQVASTRRPTPRRPQQEAR